MKYEIVKTDKKPLYIILYEQLRSDIVSGTYHYGAKLPSKRILAEELNISVITVQHSFDLLCDEGYITSKERSGYYVTYKQDDLFFEPSYTNKIKAKTEINDYASDFPFSVFAKTMRKVITEYGSLILEKSPNSGSERLKNVICNYLNRSRGMQVESNQIIIGAGAEYLYSLIIQILGREKIYAAEKPSYEKIEQVYRANGVKCRLLPLCDDGIESNALKSTDAAVLHITPYRSYPSGVTASPSKRNEYIKWARNRCGYIIEDDFESEFTPLHKHEQTVFSLGDNVVYINTFSKTISPAIRVGYAVLPKSLINDFNEKVGFYSCTVPLFEQYVIAEFIDSGEFERHINRVRRKLRQKSKQ